MTSFRCYLVHSHIFNSFVLPCKSIICAICTKIYTFCQMVICNMPTKFEPNRMHRSDAIVFTPNSSTAKFNEVSMKLFTSYIERKCDPVVGAIEPRMYASSFSWESDYKPTGVSLYIKQTIMDMIAIHAEVFAISPPLVNKVLTKVVEAVAKELARLYECFDTCEGNANIQATLNVRSLEDAVSGYARQYNSGASKYFMVCRGKLKPFPNPKDAELVNELLRTFKNHNNLLLKCFKEEGIVTV